MHDPNHNILCSTLKYYLALYLGVDCKMAVSHSFFCHLLCSCQPGARPVQDWRFARICRNDPCRNDWRFARIWRNVPPGNIVMGRIDQETADTEGGHKNIKKNRPVHVYVCPGSVGHKKYCRTLLSWYLKIYSSILRWWVDQRFIVCACKYSTNLNSILFCQNQRSLFVSCSDQTANISEDHWHLKVQAQYRANPFS